MPAYFLWQHPLFNDPEFLQFEQHARLQTAANVSNIDLRIRQVLPILTEHIGSHGAEVQRTQQVILSTIRDVARSQVKNTKSLGTIRNHTFQHQGLLQRVVESLQRPLGTIVIPPIQIRGQLADWNDAPVHAVDPYATLPPGLTTLPPGLTVDPLQAQLSPSPDPDVTALPMQLDEQTPVLPASPPTVGPGVESNPVIFTLSRTIQTVVLLWLEYSVGLGNMPSSRSVYDTGGTPKFSNDTERRFWGRRLPIIQAVKRLALDRQVSEEEAAVVLENYRVHKKLTLNKLHPVVAALLKQNGSWETI